MTEFEFIAEKLMGPPTRRRGNGESEWPCPKCGHPRFHTRPHKPEFKDRFSCWRCPDFWGDAHDLLIHFYPRMTYDEQLAWLTEARREYEAEQTADTCSTSSHRGPGSAESIRQNAYDRDPCDDEFCDEADAAIAELLALLPDGATLMPSQPSGEALVLCRKALEICAQHGLHPAGFAGRVGYVIWVHEMLRDHAANCDDPDCGRECVELRARLQACGDPDCQNALQCLFEDQCQAMSGRSCRAKAESRNGK